jgi:hypothetical protein
MPVGLISKISLAIVLVSFFAFPVASISGEKFSSEKESFAQEYKTLKELLQKVKSKDSAVLYKSQIEQELARLKSSQISGDEFNTLSDEDKKKFIEKFQNNRFHCGEVTQVMEEKRRILLDPDLNQILGSLVQSIP